MCPLNSTYITPKPNQTNSAKYHLVLHNHTIFFVSLSLSRNFAIIAYLPNSSHNLIFSLRSFYPRCRTISAGAGHQWPQFPSPVPQTSASRPSTLPRAPSPPFCRGPFREVALRRASRAPPRSSAAESSSASCEDNRGSSRCSLSALTMETPLGKWEKETCLSFCPHCFPLLLLPLPLPLSLNLPLSLGELLFFYKQIYAL